MTRNLLYVLYIVVMSLDREFTKSTGDLKGEEFFHFYINFILYDLHVMYEKAL